MDFSETAYESLLEKISEAHPTVQTAGFTSDSFKPGLEGMERFDASLGHPWRRFRSIHVAGTNGKGSVCSMIAAALASRGLRVGLYTSPHLIDFRERIRIIDAPRFRPLTRETVSTLGHVRGRDPLDTSSSCREGRRRQWEGWSEAEVSMRERSESPVSMIRKEEVFDFLTGNDLSGLSYFEITTGMAFWWFAGQGVDVAVVEVGLGGRLDSTNIITPELSVITSIGLDHCAILGNTRAEIAAEKAGIFKPGVPALVWGRDDETAGVFEKAVADIGCPLIFADEARPVVSDDEFAALLASLDLQGPCQELNLRTVLAALDILDGALPSEPVCEAIAHTAAITSFRGRWEKLQDSPEVICDIGHNPPALKINFGRLAALRRPLIIIYGIMADKDLDGIAPLMPPAVRYILCAPDTGRALPAGELGKRLSRLRPDLKVGVAPSVALAVDEALALAGDLPDALVYIGGSTFVVAEAVRERFK